MKKKQLIQLLIYLAFFCACDKRQQLEGVKLVPTKHEQLVIGSPVEIIQLETTLESQLQDIVKVIIDKSSDRVFVQTNRNLYYFLGNGKFLTKLKHGRGPGEIMNILSFTVDKDNKLVYLLDMGRDILVLDYDGEFHSKYTVENFTNMDILMLDCDNAFLVSNWVEAGKSYDKFIALYSFSNEQIVERYISAEDSPYPEIALFQLLNITQRDNRIFFFSSNIFALYEYANNDFKKNVIFDFGNQLVPHHLSDHYRIKDRFSFRQETKGKDYIPFMLYAFYFNGYFLAGFDDEQDLCYGVYEKDHNIVYAQPLTEYFNLPDKKYEINPVGLQNDFIIMSYEPFELFDDYDAYEASCQSIEFGDLSINVNRNDNPVLVIIE